MGKKLVILIDGSYYAYSVYYAFPKLVNSFGEPTWVIYGIVNILKGIFIKYKPLYMVVIFDSYGSTFRDRLFEKYKSHRKPMPFELSVQIFEVYKVVKAMGFPVVIIPDFEADDIIGTLSVFFSNVLKYYVYIFSGDKDMMQLVNDNVFVMDTRYNTLFTICEVKKKFGICPSLMVDYLALLGDKSDNVPGVPGIGSVTAKILLERLGGLNILYENLDKVSFLVGLRGAKSVSIKLEKYRFLAFLSYELVTIKKDVILNISDYELSVKPIDIDSLIIYFNRYEFTSWIKSLQSGTWLKNI